VFKTIADQPVNRIDELRPWNFSKDEMEKTAQGVSAGAY